MVDSLPSDIFRADQILNNTYKIEVLLGRGGTGEVYRARNQITGRVVAIKALNAQFSGNADYIELMKREEEMRSIIHDAVVRYTECSRTDDGHVVLVMDFIDGPSLNDVMHDRSLDPKELMIIAHRVAEGLVVTHAGGIVHRDLSPDNIILRDGDPEAATIIDFGIAKDTAAGARTIVGNEFAGKYEYAAPEQLEGKAEPRSDFYALGASLLAAFSGEIPFLGATPGEIVRRKAMPLETAHVPEPLRSLIDWLTKPDLADRPANAGDILAKIDEHLRPVQSGRRQEGGQDVSQKRSILRWLAVPVVLACASLAAFLTELLDPLFTKPLPLISPYTLSASYTASGTTTLQGYAPDEIAAEKLLRAFEAAGGEAQEGLLELADGVPSEIWAKDVADLIGLLPDLQRWSLSLTDDAARVTGLAPDSVTKDRITTAFSVLSDASGLSIESSIQAGPEDLPSDTVQSMLDSLASCGPLHQRASAGEIYPLQSTIEIAGDFASGEAAQKLEDAIKPVIGDRDIKVNANVLNNELCAILAVLPAAPTNALSIWLGNGETEKPNLTGAFKVGENPIAEVHAPAGIEDGTLWVLVVDKAGKVFHVLPHINRPENRLKSMGIVQTGVRRIRVLFSLTEFQIDTNRIAFQVSDQDFGKSQIIAILSKNQLFETRRPRDESVASFTEALSERLQGREDQILGIATRIIDARP